jgi:two-component system OmpR family response regulator
MRLLLVEDDHMIGETVVDVLRAEHFAVDWIKDGVSAQAVLRTQAYDLLLLDLALPGKDGLDVLRALRAAKSRIPVLVATARDSVEQRIAGLDAGADDYVLKPYDLGELLARVRALLRRAAGRAEPVYEHMGVTINPATRSPTASRAVAMRTGTVSRRPRRARSTCRPSALGRPRSSSTRSYRSATSAASAAEPSLTQSTA